MGKRKFAIYEESDGTELDGPVESIMKSEDMQKPMTIASGETLTVIDDECLLFKRLLKVKGTLRVEGTGKVGIV